MMMNKRHLFIKLFLVGFVLLLSLACGSSGGAGVAGNRGGISGTGDPSFAKPILVENFELAHDSYGVKSKSNFSLNTLAPVFKVKASGFSQDEFKNVIIMKLKDLENGQSTTLNNIENFARFVAVSEDNTFYIYLFKSEDLLLKDSELKPGTNYEYSIEPSEGYSLEYDSETVFPSGIITTKNFTFTYPHQRSKSDSMVFIQGAPLSGINTLNPNFLLHSKYPITSYDPTATDGKYGIFDKLNVTVNGSNLFKTGSSQYEFVKVSSTAIKISVKSGLSWGSQYKLKVESKGLKVNTGNESSSVNEDDIPGAMLIHTKF
jgi:hypothetical protein